MKGKGKYLCIALIVLLTFGILSQMVNALYSTTDPWPMYRHDVTRTGYGTSTTSPGNNATVWSLVAGMNGPPVVIDGMLIYAYNYNLYALDETTGVHLWTSSNLDGTPSPLTVSGGVAYTGSTAGTIYAINITDGSKIWSQSVAPGLIYTSVAVSGRSLYFGTTDNYLYAYDTNGTYLWRYGGASLAPVYSSPAVQGNMLYFGCDNGNLYALNVSGTLPVLKWHFNTNVVNNNIRTTPVVANGKVFIGSSNAGSLYAVDVTTGHLIWKWTTTVTGAYQVYSPAYVATSPHNLIVVSAGYYNVYALYEDALPGNYTENDPGIKYWGTVLPQGTNAPIVAGGRVFVAAGTRLYALSLTGAGSIAWFYYFGGYTVQEPVVADGRVFCGVNYNKIVCFGNYFPASTYYYHVTVLGNQFVIQLVIANATPSSGIGTNLYVTLKQLNYTLQGIDSTNGWSNITIPNQMLGGPYIVTVDGGGTSPPPVVVNDGTYSSIFFTYLQSSHAVVVQGTTIVPEFPSYIVLSLLMALTFVAAAFAKKKLPKN